MPKCLVPMGRGRVIDYQLQLLKDVPDVRVVVGFRESAVMEHVRALRPDTTFVRNPHYMTTTTTDSILLATKDISDPYLMIDGDLVIDPNDFTHFLERCSEGRDLIGVTRSQTDEAVFVEVDEDEMLVTGFQRDARRDYEWCGIAYLVKARLERSTTWVYQELERFLPLPMCAIQTYEIDTPDDLRRAQRHFPQLGFDRT